MQLTTMVDAQTLCFYIHNCLRCNGEHPSTYCSALCQNSTSFNSIDPRQLLLIADNKVEIHQAISSLTSDIKRNRDQDKLHHLWDLGKTPIKVHSLEGLLQIYSNVEDARLLLYGFKYDYDCCIQVLV